MPVLNTNIRVSNLTQLHSIHHMYFFLPEEWRTSQTSSKILSGLLCRHSQHWNLPLSSPVSKDRQKGNGLTNGFNSLLLLCHCFAA